MRKYILILFLLLAMSYPVIAADCPPEGDATETTRGDLALNLLKNRTTIPDGYEHIKFYDLIEMTVPDGVSKKHRKQWPQEAQDEVGPNEKEAYLSKAIFWEQS